MPPAETLAVPPRRSLALCRLAALLVIGLFVVQAVQSQMHQRLWIHLKFGQWIVANNFIAPQSDHVSAFSSESLYFIDPSWFSQVVLAEVSGFGERLAGVNEVRQLEGGVEMLRLLHALLALLFAVLLLAAYRRRCGSLPLACAGLVLIGIVTPALPGPLRPEVFGLVLFAAVLLALSRPKLSWWALLWVPLLFALWANLHGSFVPGLFLILVFFLGSILDLCMEILRRRRELSGTQQVPCEPVSIATEPGVPSGPIAEVGSALATTAGTEPSEPNGIVQGPAPALPTLFSWLYYQPYRLLLLLLLSLIATLFTPWDRDLYLELAPLLKEYIMWEMPGWRPLEFFRWQAPQLFMVGSLGLLTLTQALSPRPFTASQLLVVLTFGLMPTFLSRLLVWWFPLVPWLLLPHWAAILECRRRPTAEEVKPEPRSSHLLEVALIVGFLAWLLPLGWLFTGRPRSFADTLSPQTPWRVALQLREPEQRWLPELADRLRASYPEGRFTGLVFTSTTTGDFLLWALPSEWPVFMHSEIQYFGRHWREYRAIRLPEPDWWEMLDQHKVNLIVIDRQTDAALAAALAKDAAWEIVQGEPSPGRGLLVAVRKVPLLKAKE